MGLFKRLKKRKLTGLKEPIQKPGTNPSSLSLQDSLSANLQTNEQFFQSVYHNCADVVYRHFSIAGKMKALLIYIEGMSNIEEMDKSVLSPLMQQTPAELENLHAIMEQSITVSSIKENKTFAEVAEQISTGNPVILVDQYSIAISVGLSKWEKRAIEEPLSESVVRGSREGFTETIAVNTSLLRRRIKSPQLKMISMNIGRQTQTKVIVAYMDGLADTTLVEEAKSRLQRIQIDGILESGYIEEFIEDHPYSPFPQILNTERPDVAAANLLEGRIVILVDGTPFVIIVPTSLYSLLQASEDYYQRFMIGTLIRWLRYGFLVMALLLPSGYVAVLTYHQEMVPTTLLLSFAKSRELIPFPALVEALIMEITFEALREAGIRLPKQVGSAVSIVGALVIGQAAVSAGLVSAPMVMVVAITGIASFTIPRYNAAIAIRMLRFPIMLLAGTLGLLGIMLGLIAIIVHLSTVRSFGLPYLSPMGPMRASEMKDVMFRAPWWALRKRPRLTGDYNQNRQPPGQKPDPSKGTE
ncbi:spore germination protein [Neobacillus sp. YIM B02564]|uniref:Spore germination protein n=1 Tax=Neobacillus paridis TaxID=2803862 RepID=A0ABS1TWR6_9BACI|nr:spore germination protein [Neobacillus paridis]